jgi:hypothetical protein
MKVGEASGVALNSKGHVFLFQRADPMFAEYDEHGIYVRSLGEVLFTHPHGLRIDQHDDLWTTDDGSHVVLKLNPAGVCRRSRESENPNLQFGGSLPERVG